MTDRPIALVTGANRGLGRSTAIALSSGYRVVVTYRSAAKSADDTIRTITAAGGDAVALRLDISDVASFGQFRADLVNMLQDRWSTDRLDVLVNNAGVGQFAPFAEVTPEQFDSVMDTNFRGTFFLIQTLVPLMADGGRIVNISTSATRHVSPGLDVYAASKAAVESISRSLAPELGARGIRINAVAPGPAATDFNSGRMRDDQTLRDTIAAHSSLGRVAEPADISNAIVGLVSDQMSWVTAERIEVSGGSFL